MGPGVVSFEINLFFPLVICVLLLVSIIPSFQLAQTMANRLQSCRGWTASAVEKVKTSSSFQNIARNPKFALYGVAILCLVTWLTVRAIKFLKTPTTKTPLTPDLEQTTARSFKAPPRKPGGMYLPSSYLACAH